MLQTTCHPLVKKRFHPGQNILHVFFVILINTSLAFIAVSNPKDTPKPKWL